MAFGYQNKLLISMRVDWWMIFWYWDSSNILHASSPWYILGIVALWRKYAPSSVAHEVVPRYAISQSLLSPWSKFVDLSCWEARRWGGCIYLADSFFLLFPLYFIIASPEILELQRTSTLSFGCYSYCTSHIILCSLAGAAQGLVVGVSEGEQYKASPSQMHKHPKLTSS